MPKDFKTKFETIDQEPVFEESIHGAVEEEDEDEGGASGANGVTGGADGALEGEKDSAASMSTTSGGGLEEEDAGAKKI